MNINLDLKYVSILNRKKTFAKKSSYKKFLYIIFCAYCYVLRGAIDNLNLKWYEGS